MREGITGYRKEFVFFFFSFSFFWEGVGSEAMPVRGFTQENGHPAAASI